jgi:ribosomal protein S14
LDLKKKQIPACTKSRITVDWPNHPEPKKKYLRLSADQICGTYKSFISQQLLGVARRRVYEKA